MFGIDIDRCLPVNLINTNQRFQTYSRPLTSLEQLLCMIVLKSYFQKHIEQKCH